MSNRLSRQDWIAHGFHVLKTEGYGGLKADRMVKALNVSRGSFYWHFSSLDDFLHSLLAAWRNEVTEATIAELKTLPDGHGQLEELFFRVLTTPQELEAAIRAWAWADGNVARAVSEVDDLRIGYLAEAIEAQGVDRDIARARAAILAWAHIGGAFAPDLAPALPKAAAEDLAAIFSSPG